MSRTLSLSFQKQLETLPRWGEVQTHRNVFADMAGDFVAGYLLGRIAYWYGNGENGKCRLRVEHNGFLWLARGLDDWFAECRVTHAQAKRALKILKKLGLIITHPFKFNGNPTLHIRLNWDTFLALYRFHIERPPTQEGLDTYRPRSEENREAQEALLVSAKKHLTNRVNNPEGTGQNPPNDLSKEADSPTTGTASGTTLGTSPSAPMGGDEKENEDFAGAIARRLIEYARERKVGITHEEAHTLVADWPAAHLSETELLHALTDGHATFGLDGAVEGKGDPAGRLVEQKASSLRQLLSTWRHFPQSRAEWLREQNAKGHSYTHTACFLHQARKAQTAWPPGAWLEGELQTLRRARQKEQQAQSTDRAKARQEQYKAIRSSLTPAQEERLREMMLDEHDRLHPKGDNLNRLHSFVDSYAQGLATTVLLDETKLAQVLAATEDESSPFDELPDALCDQAMPAPARQLDLDVPPAPPPLRDVNAGLDIPERALPFHLVRHATALSFDAKDGAIAHVEALDERLSQIGLDGQDSARVRAHVLEQAPNLPPRFEPSALRLPALNRFADSMSQELIEKRPLEWVDEELTRFPCSVDERRWTAQRIQALFCEKGGEWEQVAA